MVLLERLTRRSLLPAAIPLLLAIGCSGVDEIALKDEEISDLAFRNTRMRESLREIDTENRKLDESLRVTQQAEARVREELGRTANDLRLAREQLNTVTAQREGLRVRLENTEDANRRLEESLTRVKNIAGESAGELADLRNRRVQLEEQVKTITETNNVLSAESSRLAKEVEKLKDELLKTRAVARSLQEGTDTAVSLETQSLTKALDDLKKKNADLRGELVAIEKRLEHAQQRTEEAAVIPVGSLYTEDPDGLAKEVQGFLLNRWGEVKQGQFVWDVFDLSVLGCLVAILLCCGFIFVRWLRTRRLRRERDALRVMVQDLEETLSRGVPADRTTRVSSVANRPAPARPSGRFSAVVTTAGDSRREEPARGDAGGSPAGAHATSSGGGGDHAGTTSADPFEALLKKGGDADRREARSGSGPGDPSDASASDEDGFDDDDLANTQVMPSLSEVDLHSVSPVASRDAKGSRESKGDMEEDDKEILTELKSVLNRKFDELLR